ncbi:MAG TPA: hypothetical protein DCQ50_18475 [Chryseobacterium sp.]|nr:hypothetical protein [Chryseobacterium sp.]
MTKRQKAANKKKASKRVLVEHSIGIVKVYQIVKNRIRIRKNDARDLVMDLCCGLANFKIEQKSVT